MPDNFENRRNWWCPPCPPCRDRMDDRWDDRMHRRDWDDRRRY